MTQLYKQNGAVFIPAGITLEEVENLKDLLNLSSVRLAEEQLKNEEMKCCGNCKYSVLDESCQEPRYSCNSKNNKWELAKKND